MKVAVIDGLGGGIGKVLVEKIRKEFQDDVEIWAFGTNSTATSIMVKAGADEGATGENPISRNIDKVEVIIGTISIIIANSMMGELTPAMAEAVGSSNAIKLLLPLNRSKVSIIGSQPEPLPHLADKLLKQLHDIRKERSDNHV
ncbi:MAG: DUF3842 family protein [Thermincola sp.]|nr:DUF3842 family protein [Thermincola sp.]